jgi:uncharacterized protein (TIGR00369 family)
MTSLDDVRDNLTGFDAHLGFTMTRAEGDGVDGFVDLAPTHHQPFGIVHGGVYCSVIETAASVGGAVWFGDRGHVVGVNNSTNFLRATRDGRLTVEARPLKQGRTQQLWNVDLTDDQGRLVATGQVRLANVADTAALG